MEWKNTYRGLIMGITDMIPGVSGGTVAVILGIYDRLLEAISGFFSSQWKRHLGFLLPLGIGMASAFLLLSRLMEYLLAEFYVPTQFFFLGLIVGVIPFLIRQSEVRRHFARAHFGVMVVFIGLMASLAFIKPTSATDPITALTTVNFVPLFLAGWLASMAMLLPGISGSFVLLVLGVYPTAIHALATFNIPLILTIGSGVGIGFIVSSKGIRYLLDRHPHWTNAAVIGLITGSIAVIYPGVSDARTMMVSSITALVGLGISFGLGRRG